MDDEHEDRMRAIRAHARRMDDLDREIAEEATPEFQEERRREAEARARWRGLPPVRLRPGVAVDRLTEQEAAYLDRHGY